MGVVVKLQTDFGQPLGDSVVDRDNLLHQLLPAHDDPSYQCLCFVDWYGETVFNRLQMKVLLAELGRIRRAVETIEEEALLDHIADLVREGQTKPHRYLRFVGD